MGKVALISLSIASFNKDAIVNVTRVLSSSIPSTNDNDYDHAESLWTKLRLCEWKSKWEAVTNEDCPVELCEEG